MSTEFIDAPSIIHELGCIHIPILLFFQMCISASRINADSLQNFIFIFSVLIFSMNRNDHNQCNMEEVWK